MNINALRDQDTLLPQFYAVACGNRPSWPGAALYQSKDSGLSWVRIATMDFAASVGLCQTALGPWNNNIDVVDTTSTVKVIMQNGTLSNASEANFYAGQNVAIIRNEIVYFRYATLQGDGSYLLNTFLRGRRGSDPNMNSHIVGDRFVLVTAAAFKAIQMHPGDIGVPYLYKAVTLGSTMDATPAQTFIYEGANVKPYSGVDAYASRDSAGAVTLTWTRRDKTQGDLMSLVDVPMSETTEAYEVDVYASSTYGTLKRTLTCATPSVIYSAADQTTDFGSVQATVYVDIFQMSSVVGRGYRLRAAV